MIRGLCGFEGNCSGMLEKLENRYFLSCELVTLGERLNNVSDWGKCYFFEGSRLGPAREHFVCNVFKIVFLVYIQRKFSGRTVFLGYCYVSGKFYSRKTKAFKETAKALGK